MKTPYKQMSPFIMVGLTTLSLQAFASDITSTPFDIKPLSSGYQLAADQGNKNKQGSCGEGKCGGNKTGKEAVCGMYTIGSSHDDDSKVKDGKCGGHKVIEALCGEG